MGEYQEEQVAKGLKPTKYILGDKETDGHTHIFYLRDDLPIATTVSATATHDVGYHAHSIEEGPGDTLICGAPFNHTHTKLVIEDAGDYKPRTLFPAQ